MVRRLVTWLIVAAALIAMATARLADRKERRHRRPPSAAPIEATTTSGPESF